MPDDPPIRLVCFDLGGVLVRIARGWEDACARAGVALPHADADADAWERHRGLMLRYETGEIDEPAYMSEAPACIGAGVSGDVLVRVFDAWLLGLYPGAAGLIDDLRRAGVRTACLSNTNARHWDALGQLPEYRPLARLDYRLASHEMRVMKPAPGAYRHAERVTDVRGGAVLFFDDKPENVAAARAVGWKAEVVDRADDAVPQVRQFLSAHRVL